MVGVLLVAQPSPGFQQNSCGLALADFKQKKSVDSSNELRRTALSSAASLTLPDSSTVLTDTASGDNNAVDRVPSTQQAVEDLGPERNSNPDISAKQDGLDVNTERSHPVSREQASAGFAQLNGDPSAELNPDANPKTLKKETKRLQKEKKELEKQLRRTEDEEEKRESRSAKRESRRLSKKQPFKSSSRSSSVRSAMRSSAGPMVSSFRRSISGSRASSSHGNPPSDVAEQAKQTTDTGMAVPTFSGPWPERFGAAVSRELASGKQPPYSPYSPPNHAERSLHSPGKFADLRASARLSKTVGPLGKPRVQSMDVSLYERQLSSNVADAEIPGGTKENEPNEGHRRSLVDPYTLTPYDTAADAEPEQQSEQRTSGTPRFYANLHNIQGLAGSQSTLKGVARRCPPAYVAPDDPKQNERSRLSSSNLGLNTGEISPRYPSARANNIWTPSTTPVRTESNRYTAIFKSSSTPIPTYTRENSQRSSMLPSRLRSKHTRFTSSPLAPSSTGSLDLDPNLGQANKSEPVLVPDQNSSVKPQLPELNCGEPGLFTSSQESVVESAVGVKSPKTRPNSSIVLVSPTVEEPKGTSSKNNAAATPMRSHSSRQGSRKPLPKQTPDFSPPARSQTLPANGQPSWSSAVDAAAKSHDTRTGIASLGSPSHARVKNNAVMSVNSEGSSENYSTASENASNESEPHKTAANRRSPSPTFNLFGNGSPPPNTVPQAHKNRMSLGSDHQYTAPLPSTHSLPANGPALRHSPHPVSIGKTFVICCQCNFWHDMPSNVYAKLASPHNATASLPDATSRAGSSPRSRQIENTNGTTSLRRSSDGRNNANVNGNNGVRGRIEANTSVKVIPNISAEENAKATRENDGKPRSPITPSSSVSAPNCCWCNHGMQRSCCAGWSTTVHMHERYH